MKRLTVDRETCNRTGMCYFSHPELFREGEEGFPEPVRLEENEAFPEEAAEDAVVRCPTGSITVTRDEDT